MNPYPVLYPHLRTLRQILCMAFLAFLLMPWLPPARADIYGYRDKDGSLRFLPAAVGPKSAKQDQSGRKGDCSAAVEGIIRQAASRFKVEPCLVKAMIKIESDFDQRAVSHRGAMGLMQLMPQTARDMDVKNPFNPTENIAGGTRYLSLLLDRFKHDIRLTLAAYNAGPEKVEACGDIPPIEETQSYVRRVLNAYRLYKEKDLSLHEKEADFRNRKSEVGEPKGDGSNS